MTSLQIPLAVPVRTLVLIGGGEFSFGETREIDQFLLTRMPPDRRTVAFLPTASGSAEYAGHFGKYLRELEVAPTIEVVNVPVYRGRDSRRPKNLSAITSAGLVYLGGGVTNNFLSTIYESATDLALREAAANGTVIAAIGAAASCFGVFARDMRGGTGALSGLGWLANTVVDTGFEAGNDVTLRRLMSAPGVELGIGLPAQTAIVIGADGSTEIIGNGQIAAFRKPTVG
ncbi:MAG: dipeptidase [Acidobacteriota bacterium]|jgi:cyanophycinase-like exopeptidase|nr:dipeptidase [Acidobacteriota bacterium]